MYFTRLNDGQYAFDCDFRQLYKIAIQDGILSVRYNGFFATNTYSKG